MGIEEKAKAYEMALEAARKELGVDRKEWEVVQRVLHNVLPELRESEDERIRKALVKQFGGCIKDDEFCHTGFTYAEITAWLEKQKEQKPDSLTKYVYSKEDEKFIQDCANILVANDYDKSAERLLSMLKQKPVEWSEEDEKMRDSILEELANHICYNKPLDGMPSGTGWTSYKYQQEMDWLTNRLKSLRPPKDCSACSKNLEGYISGRSDAENKLLEMYGILLMPDGELRMKPRWKPSEEQMEALNAIATIGQLSYSGQEQCLIDLFHELKKLMED